MMLIVFVALILAISFLMFLHFGREAEKISIIKRYEDGKIGDDEDISLKELEECKDIQRKQQSCEHHSVRKCKVGHLEGEEDYFVCRECGASSTRQFGEVK